MRIAIVGTGIAGMTSAWLLHQEHDITVYEGDVRIGGHTNTVGGNHNLALPEATTQRCLRRRHHQPSKQGRNIHT